MLGQRLGPYEVLDRLGAGGMGTVYRARDTELDRTVAIKVLEVDADARTRLLHEARAASALTHPNCVTIHGVEQHDGRAFIVMEYVEGQPLDRLIPPGGLPLPQALRYGVEIADALADAHAHGVVHRDIKPGNVMITAAGRVKVLDFGIARRTALPDDATRAATLGTGPVGAVVGTPGYMAPEQITGHPGGPPSDVFALGALLHQMLTGAGPFAATSTWDALDATMRREPPSLAALKPGTPPAVAEVVARALAKDPSARYASAAPMRDALRTIEGPELSTRRGRSWVTAAAVLVAAIAVAGGLWYRQRLASIAWVHDEAIPEIGRLASVGDPVSAYRLAQRALAVAPDDARLRTAWDGASSEIAVTSEPPGAEVAIRSLSGQDDAWTSLGRTPLTVEVPLGQMRWRFSLAGYDTREIIPSPVPDTIVLDKPGTLPPGTVRVAAGEVEVASANTSVKVPAFVIEATEVTNRQFKAFVDAGGYQKREYWTQPFVRDGRTLSWEDAQLAFRDATGRPGPSTWELGSYPDGAAEFPVSGVSWYEAAAYAAYAKRSLPTVYHWYRAAGADSIYSDVVQTSNFDGKGPRPVGASGSLGPYGTTDLAGNVKEWVWNESEHGLRFVLGGAWFEARHSFRDEDARAPFTRDAGFGFRCILPDGAGEASLLQPIRTLERDPAALTPVADDVFRVYRQLYDYDPRPLNATVEERAEDHPEWIAERVSFTAAYGDERLPVMLMLPRTGRPPYQVVVYFPGSDATRSRSSRGAYTQWVQFLLRSGRAVAFPVYQQTYERRRTPTGANFLREISIERGLDVRRTIDYLASRPDLDANKIAFFGVSLGAQLAPVYLAVEPRLRTGVLMSGGFETWTIPPESDPVNFAPRVRQPVLMVNGREDFDLPYETAQVPLFNALGTPAGQKRHAVLAGGHIPPRPQELYKEILDWLDRYLGPVGE